MTRRKITLYLPSRTIDEAHAEAARLERQISWVMQLAWRIARAEVRQLPGRDETEAMEYPMPTVSAHQCATLWPEVRDGRHPSQTGVSLPVVELLWVTSRGYLTLRAGPHAGDTTFDWSGDVGRLRGAEHARELIRRFFAEAPDSAIIPEDA